MIVKAAAIITKGMKIDSVAIYLVILELFPELKADCKAACWDEE